MRPAISPQARDEMHERVDVFQFDERDAGFMKPVRRGRVPASAIFSPAIRRTAL